MLMVMIKRLNLKIYENVLSHKIYVKCYNKFYNIKIIEDRITGLEKNIKVAS